jgi:hypothetical protein
MREVTIETDRRKFFLNALQYNINNNNIINGFDQRVARQELCKLSTLHNNRGSCVFYVIRTKQQ